MDRLQDLFASTPQPVSHTTSGTTFTPGTSASIVASGLFSRRRSSLKRGASGKGGGEGAGRSEVDEIHAALEEAQQKIGDFYRALCTSSAVQVQSAAIDAELQGKLDEIQAALRTCRDRINDYETHTAHARTDGDATDDHDGKTTKHRRHATSHTPLLSDTQGPAGEGSVSLNATQLRMRRNVTTHAKEKLRGLTLRAWAAEDRLREFHVERTARQLRLRLTGNLVADAMAGDGDAAAQNHTAATLYSDPDVAETKPADGGALVHANAPLDLNDNDYQLLAESVIYAKKDGEVFALTPYDLRQAVERYQAVCQIEEKTRLLHHLFTEMNWLVQEQGESLNEAQKQVDKGYRRARKGTEQLRRGKTYNSRCCCGCCCSLM